MSKIIECRVIWDLLSRAGAIEALMSVYYHPDGRQDEIATGTKRGTILRRLDELCEAGLIVRRKESQGRTIVHYNLSEEGNRICRLLLLIRDGGSDVPMDCGTSSEGGITANGK